MHRVLMGRHDLIIASAAAAAAAAAAALIDGMGADSVAVACT